MLVKFELKFKKKPDRKTIIQAVILMAQNQNIVQYSSIVANGNKREKLQLKT